MDVKNNNEMHYDAFISYRHSDLDKFVAEELHRQLETFKIPKKIGKIIGKKRINRIFRDKDELPITSNLADPIINALRGSDFLIVICSPRLNESIWCKREIENFIAMHGQERVLAVLIEGEPSDSFPQELLYREKTITLENGETEIVKEPVEPLAADVRGKTKKEIKKRIKTEILRLLAPMLNCNYDDLKQRHKERKMHQILALAGIIGFVGITFGTVSTIMALLIQSQKEQINEQYAEIKEQKEQIDKQYWEALETNAIMSSENAMELLDVGDRIGAINLAKELLPKDLKNQDIPYTTEAFYALTQSIYPYVTGDVLRPVYQIKTDAEIYSMILADDWNKIGIRTKYDQLVVWDITNKEKCLEVDMSRLSDSSVYSNGITFLGNDKIALLTYNEVLILDLENNIQGEISKQIEFKKYGYPSEIFSDSDGKYFIVVFEQGVAVYDANTYDELKVFETKEGMETVYGKSRFYGKDKIIFCEEASEKGTENISIYVADLSSGEVIWDFEVPYGRVAEVEASADFLYIAVNGDEEELTSLFDSPEDADVYCFDLSTGAKRWEHHVDEEYINNIVIPYEGYDCFLFESYAQITALDAKTGEMIGRFSLGSSVVSIFALEEPDSYRVFTRDGSYITFVPEQNYNYEVVGRFIPASNNLKQFEWGNGFMVSLPYASKELIVYEWYQDPEGEKNLQFEESVLDYITSSDEKYGIAEFWDDKLAITDNETKEIIAQFTCEDYIEDVRFLEDNTIQCISGSSVWLYNTQGELLEHYEVLDDYIDVEHVSTDGKYIFGKTLYNLVAINCRTKEVEKEISRDILGDNTEYRFSNNGDKCVILDKGKRQCKLYDVGTETELANIDINATYIDYIQFSENDTYVYIVYEDGKVEQYISDSLELKCQVTDLENVTDEIYECVVNGENKYFFSNPNGAYVLSDCDGQLKVEQFVPHLEAVNMSANEYWVIDYKTVYTFPIYTYEEILGKAEQICYDNSLWNN